MIPTPPNTPEGRLQGSVASEKAFRVLRDNHVEIVDLGDGQYEFETDENYDTQFVDELVPRVFIQRWSEMFSIEITDFYFDKYEP